MNEKEKEIRFLANMITTQVSGMCAAKDFTEFVTMYVDAKENLNKLSKTMYHDKFGAESEEWGNDGMIKLFVDQVGVDKSKLEYLAGFVCEHNGNFMIGFEMMGARETFSVGQPVYDREGNLIGYLGIGLYDALDYTTNKNTRIPVYYWQICMPTEYCVVGKSVFTYWQNEKIMKKAESEE